MFSIIVEAAKNFLQNQIELQTEQHENLDSLSQLRTVIATIDVEMDSGETKTVFLGFNEALIKAIVAVYLMEEDADEQTLQDMAMESTNMIVGSAKVLAEEAEESHFTIATPVFKAIEEFQTCHCSELSILQTPKEALVIGIKG